MKNLIKILIPIALLFIIEITYGQTVTITAPGQLDPNSASITLINEGIEKPTQNNY